MAKFSGTAVRPQVSAPVATTPQRTRTHEGGLGYERDAKSELFLLAVSNMVGETTFYESAGARDARFEALVRAVVVEDPEWVARFVPYLRDTMQMRSASVVMAGLYAAAGGPNARRVIDAACSRADEPAEMLAWWVQTQGRRLPAAVKRGIADAVRRLYHEGSVLRYDGLSRAWRMADVVEMVHPRPRDDAQSAVYRYLLDRRHHGDERPDPAVLPKLAAAKALDELPGDQRRAVLDDPSRLSDAGFSWERLSGWLPGGMDAAAWEAVIPSMGYMALLRNLRNFDEAGVRDAVLDSVAARLSDPDEVAKSRQFPLRFYSAWKATQNGSNPWRWGQALERALDHSVANVPSLSGRTLVLIDMSGSMICAISNRSTVLRWEVAAVFGAALARRCESATLVPYSHESKVVPVSGTTLMTVRAIQTAGDMFGGTWTEAAMQQHYAGHDRIVLLTDEQAHDAGGSFVAGLPCPIYTFNLAGYKPAGLPSGRSNRYTFGGLTDAGFRVVPLLESCRDQSWPF